MKYLQAKCLLTLLVFILTVNSVLAQMADYTYTASSSNLCTPIVLTFKNTSTGTALGYKWDFGDGRTSTEVNPQITYTTGGVKRITLEAQYYANGGVITSSYYKDVTIGSTPVISFSADVTKSCKAYTANFTDATPGAASRTWDFGDGTVITTANANIQHNYTKAGKFDVTLKVSNASGCEATLTKSSYIDISLPDVDISAPVSGCVPYNAIFTATSTNTVNDPAVSYSWNFGDGQSAIINGNSTTHQYSQTGTYDVALTVTTQSGCTISKTYAKQVHTGNPPSNVSFTIAPTAACVGEPVRLIANANYADTYSWNFGDGQTASGSENDIKHNFNANGTLTVNMQAGSNGCYTPAAPATVTITGPVSQFNVIRDCNNKSMFVFTNSSSGINANTKFEWDFGDNSPVTNTRDASHIYTVPGDYTVRLTISENGSTCTHSSFQKIYYFKPDFTSGISSICRGSKATYEVLNVPLNLVSSYTWNFGDGTNITTTSQTAIKAWNNAGTFTNQLVIHYKDPAYCDDIVSKNNDINILAPQANFSIGSAMCAGQPVAFLNQTIPSTNIPITDWLWDLGNGQKSTAQVPPATKYGASGTQIIKLVVTDARNCKDSVTKGININPTPFVKVNASQAKICEGSSVTLQATSDGTIQWLNASDLSCNTCVNPVATPMSNTRYIVQSSNVYGCTEKDSTDITVVAKVNMRVNKDTIACYGTSVQLKAEGASYYKWTPVSGLTNDNVADPVTTPTEDITYYVTGTNDPMCPMSAPLAVKVEVKPVPEVNAGKDQTVMVGSIVTMRASGSPDVVKYTWTPTDYLDNPNSPYVTAAVRKSMTYSVTGTNQYGCTKSDVMNIDLVCNSDVMYIPNTFSPNGDGMNEVFYVRGKGISFIKSFRLFNRWGQEVYHREHINVDDIAVGWNGNFNGKPQPSGVYIYFIEAYCDTNEFFQLKGNVTLLR